VLVRWGIRLASSLIGVAVGFLIADIALKDFSISGVAIVGATLLFWIIHLLVDLVALRVLIRERSIALAALVALASTTVTLIIVDIVFSGVSISGVGTYAVATLIIWITTAVADFVGHRMIRARRVA
jgi:hypothetical protein